MLTNIPWTNYCCHSKNKDIYVQIPVTCMLISEHAVHQKAIYFLTSKKLELFNFLRYYNPSLCVHQMPNDSCPVPNESDI
jgi:hypothetical protein